MGHTIDPPRNFSIPLEERVRALCGPPAYIRRKRAIEDIEQGLVARAREASAAGRDVVAEIARDLVRLNDLIDRHNRYYPAEANLPYHPRTGQMLDRVGGRPWTPLEAWTLETLLAKAQVRV